jgi:signal transduction histidine kinase
VDDVRFADLISKIAHELRSPLTSVKGFSATLVKRWDRFTDEQKLQFVQTINSDAERMGRIVSEVLDLARLESGRLELHRTQIDLSAIAVKATEHLSSLPGADRVKIDVPDGFMAFGDAERLQHVIGNLLENAIKFSDDGDIVVAAESQDGHVTFSVTDAGVGIDPERLPEIFKGPAPAGQRSGPSGSGLGLYLTRRLIEAHGGEISVDSRLQEGSTFTVTLPADGQAS